MSEIQVTPLGAGQDVGRSCIIVNILNKRIMLDCGMHMGYHDEKKFPDFKYISNDTTLDNSIDCVIISHFHLDHCGALPYMTEMVGYNGPIYMTLPTKSICPIQLEDMRKIAVDRQKDEVMFTSEMITKCFSKVTAVNLNESIMVDDDITIKAYYAGHVLGAAMFEVKVKHLSFVYTGDYNMAPDRHLGSASIDCCYPDLLITETTYATTIRDNKYVRERDFLKKLTQCLKNGGKVLIPVFALGRAQEICLLLENYWERMNMDVPIFFSSGIAEKSLDYYKLFVMWMNQRIKRDFYKHNVFNFRHIKPLDRSHIDMPGPMVVLASPGMLHAGYSLQIFKKWCNDEKNMVIVPGYCVKGTYGHRILSGEKKINFEPHNPNAKSYEIRMAVEYLSFSAHADSKGIMQLIEMCKPANVLLVHGEAAKMQFFKQKVFSEFGIPCFNPDNGETASVPVQQLVPVEIDYKLYKEAQNNPSPFDIRMQNISGILSVDENKNNLTICSKKKFLDDNNLSEHNLRITFSVDVEEELAHAKLMSIVAKILSDLGIYSDFYETKSEKVYSIYNSLWFKIHSNGKVCKKITMSWLIEDDVISQKFVTQLTKCLKVS